MADYDSLPKKKCNPHRWDVEEWLPLLGTPLEDSPPKITCLVCGRVIWADSLTPARRTSIASGIASRMFGGERHADVFISAIQYFHYHWNKKWE